MSGICGDCPEYERIIDSQAQENAELKRKLEKAVEALENIAEQDIMPSWELIDWAQKAVKEIEGK